MISERLSVCRVENELDREKALRVLEVVYRDEKGWASDRESMLPSGDLGREQVSWFLVQNGDEPIGVTRVLYELPLELYEEYGFELADSGLDVEAFVRENRIAEVGRFAVLPEYRNRILVAASLMRAAATETVKRGFTHFITDVFEEDPNSPYRFHSRILGFQTVATHSVGELHCKGRRFTMLLDLGSAYQRLQSKGGWIFRFITEGWDERVIQRLTA